MTTIYVRSEHRACIKQLFFDIIYVASIDVLDHNSTKDRYMRFYGKVSFGYLKKLSDVLSL